MLPPALLPNVPRTQALKADTFCPPPLDGSLTLPEIYDWHFLHSPKHPLFCYYSNEEYRVKELHYEEVVGAMRRVAKHVRALVEGDGQVESQSSESPIIAILAIADSLSYFTTMFGIVLAGCTPFAVSPRNSAAAIAHLLSISRARYIICSSDSRLQETLQMSLQIMSKDHTTTELPKILEMPTFQEALSPTSKLPPCEPWVTRRPRLDSPAVIMHSSGSTKFPKLISWSHRACMRHTLTPWFGAVDLCGTRFAMHSTPMFHAMGGLTTLYVISSGTTMAVFEPQVPAIIPTQENYLQGISDTASDFVLTVPSFLEEWVKDPGAIPILRKLKGILYAGGPLTGETGDYLVSKGVPIMVSYGCTETGSVSQFIYEPHENWEYFPLNPALSTTTVPNDLGQAELHVRSDGMVPPIVINTEYDGVSAYATSDLLTPHPSIPGLWTIHGRVDDQVIHANGEKTNPGPLEVIIACDPHIQACVIFGRGQFHPGVIVEPKAEFQFDPTDSAKLVAFRNAIWPAVERANDFAPQHSRLFKEAILVTHPEKPFTYTAKDTVRRGAVLKEYEHEIHALYQSISENTQARAAPPSSWELESTTTFVRKVITNTMKIDVRDDEDIFSHGCDSLQATWIRNSISHALRTSSSKDTHKITQNLVYQYPTVSKLSQYLSSICIEPSNRSVGALSSPEETKTDASLRRMYTLVEKYTRDFPVHEPSAATSPPDIGNVFLLTGTTRGLGSCLLTELIQRDDVQRVYALNRESRTGQPLMDRQGQAFVSRGLDTRLLESEKLVLLEGRLEEPGLGLEVGVLAEVRSSVTHIIHNAWRVDFNLTLSSFEPNIKSLRNLIDLGLSSSLPSPPVLLFVSSIGVFRNADQAIVQEELPLDPHTVLGSGYSESKWVGERILEHLGGSTPMKGVVVRLGQLCGSGGASGAWNTSEWLPAMIRSSVTLGCLPELHGKISWIPLETAAHALLDASIRGEDSLRTPLILHLVHPRPVQWLSIFFEFANALNLPLVPYLTWLAKLEDAQKNDGKTSQVIPNGRVQLEAFPALRLMDTFRAAGASSDTEDGEAMGLPRLSTTNMLRCAPVLNEASPLGRDDVCGWITGWKSVGFLP